jgi:tetratricopeptide (TPR) repeat protein
LRRHLLILAAALIAYSGALLGSFHLDDYSLMANPLITATSGVWRMWEPVNTRPLTNLTFWLNYQAGGQHAWGYHAVNLLLHLAAVSLLYMALKLILTGQAAFWAALFFAVHPLQSEAVAYVFARGTLLSAVFCLGALYFWLQGRFPFAVACFACALLAKEECVTFPLILLLVHPMRGQWRPLACMIGLAALAGGRAVWATAQVAGSGAGFGTSVAPLHYLTVQGVAIFRYLRLLAVPWGFTVEPGVELENQWLYGAAWALVLAVTIACWMLRKRFAWAIWVVSGLILLVPSSSLFPASDFAADRRMYLPMVAFSAAFGVLTPWLRSQVPAAIIIVLTSLSIARMGVWRTEQNLWREAVNRSPTHVRPLLQLSRATPDEEAVSLLIQAKALEPANGDISAELGRLWLKTRRYDFALQEFGRALALQPNNANALNNRGAALLGLKQEKAARHDFERALQIDPCVLAARKNLEMIGGSVLPACPAIEK